MTTGRIPREAIAAKRLQATKNRERIAAALIRMQRSNTPINVTAVASSAGVSPDTIRRNPDLFDQVKRLRSQQWEVAGPVGPTVRTSEVVVTLKAKLALASQEVADLRREIAVANSAAYQALGQAGTMLDPTEAEALITANAELTVALQTAQQDVERLRDEASDLRDELTACHELNREFTRQLTQAHEVAQRARTEAGSARRDLKKVRDKGR